MYHCRYYSFPPFNIPSFLSYIAVHLCTHVSESSRPSELWCKSEGLKTRTKTTYSRKIVSSCSTDQWSLLSSIFCRCSTETCGISVSSLTGGENWYSLSGSSDPAGDQSSSLSEKNRLFSCRTNSISAASDLDSQISICSWQKELSETDAWRSLGKIFSLSWSSSEESLVAWCRLVFQTMFGHLWAPLWIFCLEEEGVVWDPL